mgnify:FL=1
MSNIYVDNGSTVERKGSGVAFCEAGTPCSFEGGGREAGRVFQQLGWGEQPASQPGPGAGVGGGGHQLL